MSLRSDSRGCCNLNCPVALRSQCGRAVPVATAGATLFVPMRNGCDHFSRKEDG